MGQGGVVEYTRLVHGGIANHTGTRLRVGADEVDTFTESALIPLISNATYPS
jgi:hypothetical protein